MTDVKPKAVRRLGDIVFANLTFLAGISILLTLATVAAFLFAQSVPAFTGEPIEAAENGFWAYVFPFIFGTVYASVIALAIATPLAIGTIGGAIGGWGSGGFSGLFGALRIS